MSKLQELAKLYGGPVTKTSDYIETKTKPKKKKKKAVKQLGGFVVKDVDKALSVASTAKEESDSDDQPEVYVDEETKEQWEHEQMLQRASRSGWVDLSEKTGDLSPKRKRKEEDSPPRKKMRVESTGSPPRRPTNPSRDNSSPPRRTSDDSPPRKRTSVSPPRRRNVEGSPPRKSSESPPRRNTNSSPKSTQDASNTSNAPNNSNTSTVKRAGLYTGAEIHQEIIQKKEQLALQKKNMDPSASGKNAPTIYRDKHGRPLRMLNKMEGGNYSFMCFVCSI